MLPLLGLLFLVTGNGQPLMNGPGLECAAIFVTSGKNNVDGFFGNGGVSTLDEVCNGLSPQFDNQTWRALVSFDNEAAHERMALGGTGCTYNMLNQSLGPLFNASGWPLQLQNQITTEGGVSVVDVYHVWTGYNSMFQCANWTNNSPGEFGSTGDANLAGDNGQWFAQSNTPCDGAKFYYCFRDAALATSPTTSPTSSPTSPTSSPSSSPSPWPSPSPTSSPTSPTASPSHSPTLAPASLQPSNAPSSSPTHSPSLYPSLYPTLYPSPKPVPSPLMNVVTAPPTPLPPSTSSPSAAPTPAFVATNTDKEKNNNNASDNSILIYVVVFVFILVFCIVLVLLFTLFYVRHRQSRATRREGTNKTSSSATQTTGSSSSTISTVAISSLATESTVNFSPSSPRSKRHSRSHRPSRRQSAHIASNPLLSSPNVNIYSQMPPVRQQKRNYDEAPSANSLLSTHEYAQSINYANAPMALSSHQYEAGPLIRSSDGYGCPPE